MVADGFFGIGTQTFSFDARDLPSGIYLYRMSTAGFTTSRRMSLLR
ncbi:MAG: hypothetical protein ACI84D_000809 [Thalassolituus oleivorans]|jgi:hypothetical protein